MRALPKVKLFMQPWLPAAAPNALRMTCEKHNNCDWFTSVVCRDGWGVELQLHCVSATRATHINDALGGEDVPSNNSSRVTGSKNGSLRNNESNGAQAALDGSTHERQSTTISPWRGSYVASTASDLGALGTGNTPTHPRSTLNQSTPRI